MGKSGRLSLLIFICVVSLSLAVCDNSIDSGLGSFTISLGDANSRAALWWDTATNSESLDHYITVTDSEGNKQEASILSAATIKTAAFTGLALGDCTIHIEGKTASGDLKSVATQTETIKAGSNGPFTITMSPPPGTLNIVIPDPPTGTLTPIDTVSFIVEVTGFRNNADATGVVLAAAGPDASYTCTGDTANHAAVDGVKTFTIEVMYDGASSSSGTETLTFSLIPASVANAGYDHYFSGTRTTSIRVIDGEVEARAIPVKQGNIANQNNITDFQRYVGGWPQPPHKFYELVEDVTLPSTWQTSIEFNGTFDGKGKTITNNNVNSSGVFSQVKMGSTVKNLHVACNFSSPSVDYVGGIAGSNSGTIEKCYVSGNITGKDSVGGIVGSNSGTIRNCYSSAIVTGNDEVGGIAGRQTGSNPDPNISVCYTSSTVTITGEDKVGGIVGKNDGGKVESCVALNQSIIQKAGSTGSEFGRVVGMNSGAALDPAYPNYGLDGMSIPHTINPGVDDQGDKPDGATVSSTEYVQQTWWENLHKGSSTPYEDEWKFGPADTNAAWKFSGGLPKLAWEN